MPLRPAPGQSGDALFAFLEANGGGKIEAAVVQGRARAIGGAGDDELEAIALAQDVSLVDEQLHQVAADIAQADQAQTHTTTLHESSPANQGFLTDCQPSPSGDPVWRLQR